MWRFDWTEAMSVAIEELDEDHKRSVRIMNLIGAAASAADFSNAEKMRDALAIDLAQHFRREERILARYGYPRLKTHILGHRAANDELQKFAQVIKTRNVIAILGALDDLRLFFVERLIIDDIDYKWFFLDRRIVPEFNDEPAVESPALDSRD